MTVIVRMMMKGYTPEIVKSKKFRYLTRYRALERHPYIHSVNLYNLIRTRRRTNVQLGQLGEEGEIGQM